MRKTAILGAALAAALGGSGCGEKGAAVPVAKAAAAAPEAGAVPVRLVKAEPVSFRGQLVATGDLKPDQHASLSFAVPGTLKQVEVKRGQALKKGDVLAALDAALARATVSQAQAGLAAAEAQARMAKDALERAESMKAAEGVSAAQLLQARAQAELAEAQVQAARAQKEQADVNLRHHTLRAPFDGVVTKVPDGVGVAVGPGMPLFSLEQTSTLVLATTVTAAEAKALVAGARVQVATPAAGGATDDATVRAVVPSADPMTHRVPVEIAVPNGDGRFLAHSFARARLTSAAERPALKVPAGALVQRDGAFSVWVAGADGLSRTVRVEVLGQEGDEAVIEPAEPLDGVQVVDLPPPALVAGQKLAQVAR